MATPLAITADNRGPLVNIATWITLVAMVLMTLTKVATKWVMTGRFQADDGLMVVAMVRRLEVIFDIAKLMVFIVRRYSSVTGCESASHQWIRTASCDADCSPI